MTPEAPAYLPLGPHRLHYLDRRATEETVAEIFGGEDYAFRSARAEPYVIDGGANIGVSVLWFKQRHPACRVVAFEPDPVSLGLLRHNIAANGLEGVTVVEAALGGRDGEADLWGDLAVPDSRGYSVVPEWGRQSADSAARRVRTVSLRPWLDRPCDFLKLDIEGAEYDVLADVADRLHLVDALYVECHETGGMARVEPTLELLAAAGLRGTVEPKDLFPFLPDHHLQWAREREATMQVIRARRAPA